ncbi:cysteine desulfuration protein SufE [Andreprevotia lacus DSM 23236]|jgi:cysteine desulfuration protein SufE|uniref:Cysteine desulfuration protein SufE n=1 Tax=Andreprevotia lacus DSM 23236 TaxID=1121001 RepID=A0A1W1XDX7_9NEIS|nr:SufE family protein [Andreprevotia lacus]SMC22052.1 cysteine desulfuration protein SufE [Andreprevotia lacus DSM 23236]
MSETAMSNPYAHPFGTTVDRDALSQRLLAAGGWEAKSRLLVQLARDLPPLPDADKVDANRVSGCESTVWLVTRWEGGKLQVAADSDSRVIKGLLTLLLTAYHNQDAATIQQFALEAWLTELGLVRFLSASRGNGVRAIARRIVSESQQPHG